MINQDPTFSVIIPVLNKWEMTKNCLISLHKHTKDHHYEVIVVDNGSTDETTIEVRTLGKKLFANNFHVIVFDKNRNFAPACNAGAKIAKAPFLFFLNNDTLLLPKWASPLLESLTTEKNLGAVGPLLIYENSMIQHVGVTFSIKTFFHIYQDLPSSCPVFQKPRKVQALTGAALMISQELFFSCGSFFEDYCNGYEDLDLSLRMLQKGKDLKCIPQSRIIHLESQTPGRKDGEEKNKEIFFKRWYDSIKIDVHRHALRDGFTVKIDDLLRLSIVLTDEEENRLNASAGSDIGQLIEQLQTYPLWLGGWQRLAKEYTKRQKFDMAIQAWVQRANIYPDILSMQMLLAIASKANRIETINTANNNLQRIQAIKTNMLEQKYFYQQLRKKATLAEDSFLLSLANKGIASL